MRIHDLGEMSHIVQNDAKMCIFSHNDVVSYFKVQYNLYTYSLCQQAYPMRSINTIPQWLMKHWAFGPIKLTNDNARAGQHFATAPHTEAT